MSILEDYINIYQPWHMVNNLVLNFNLHTINCWPSLFKLASVWRDIAEENMIYHYKYYQPFPPSHILCVACRFSCWIHKMVPTAASTSCNRDTFSGILDNSNSLPLHSFLSFTSFFVIFPNYLQSYFFITYPPISRVKDY